MDLDKEKVLRNEGRKKQPDLIFGGKTFKLPVEIPIPVVHSMRDLSEAFAKKDGQKVTDALEEAAKLLLGSQYDDFMALQPSVSDLSAIVEGLPAEYGITTPKSSRSPKSSTNTGGRAKRASKQPTVSTSDEPVTAESVSA